MGERVLDEVDKSLPREDQGVPVQRVGVAVDGELASSMLGVVLHARKEGREVDYVESYRFSSCLRSGQCEQCLDEAVEPLRLAFDDLDEAVALLGVVFGARLEDVNGAPDGRQRCAEFVGCVRDELAFCAFAPLALGDVGQDEHGGVEAPPQQGQTGDHEGRVGVRTDRQSGRARVGVRDVR